MINKKSGLLILLVLAGCLIMAFVDAIISPPYGIKAGIKLFVFLSIPVGYSLFDKGATIRSLFKLEKKPFLQSLLLGAIVYAVIISAYFLVGSFFDFSKVTTSLQSKIGVNKNNFVFVAIYISFINSLLEEFFFRGFAFLTLKKMLGRRVSYIFSALTFSVYHIAIMTSWFTPLLFVLLISGLFIAGVFFNWLDEKTDSIYTSWFVHMFANFSINTIGFILFGIL